MEIELKKICEAFSIQGYQSIKPFGEGHIHQTFFLTTSQGKFIVQRFNHLVFKDLEIVEKNYLELKSLLKGNPLFLLNYLSSKSGSIFHFQGNQPWRVAPFIEHTKKKESSITIERAHQTALAFACFAKVLSQGESRHFSEPIPGFLDPGLRFSQFQQALRDTSHEKKLLAEELISTYQATNPSALLRKLKKTLPLRIIHGDTKLNNILLKEDGSISSIIDIDTVMPGHIMCDFGDLVRSTCGRAAEDDPQMREIRTDLYQSIRNGYMDADFLDQKEVDSLPFGAKLMTWLTGIRFLTDFLNGDIYYKIERTGQNLDRSRSQMNLLQTLQTIN